MGRRDHRVADLGRFALFGMMGDGQFTHPAGGDAIVHLWSSDQGLVLPERHVLTDIDRVPRITRAYYDTGSYAGLDAVT